MRKTGVAVGCGALATNGTWRTFMCYNLGATKTTIAEQLAYANNLYYNGGTGHVPATAAESDSAVYGHLYQWGRIGDGHQRRSSVNSDVNGPAPGTYTRLDSINGSEQIRHDSVRYYGKFITNNANNAAPYDWNRNPSGRNVTLWRNYRYTPNDPCAKVAGANWRIPIQSEWGDIFKGGLAAGAPGTANANTWEWVNHGKGTNNSFSTPGGYKIKPDGVTTTLFLPAAGSRSNGMGQFDSPGVYGAYWSTTIYGNFSYYLSFNGGNVIPANHLYRAYGVSVRCIADNY
jgi:uncharacterized protein (TIGR02145 family)